MGTLKDIGPQSRSIAMLEQALAVYEAEVRDLQRVIAEQSHLVTQARVALAERDAMAASTSWRITQPLRALVGFLKGDENHRADLSRLFKRRRARASSPQQSAPPAPARRAQESSGIRELLPLSTYPEPGPGDLRRITLVLDAVHTLESDETALTAALAAVMLAQRNGWLLRVVTREALVDPDAFSAAIGRHGVWHRDDVDFEASPPRPFAPPLGVTRLDYFITPADAVAWSVVQSVDPSRVCVVLRADAGARLPPGPELQRHESLMRLPGPRIVLGGSRLTERPTDHGLNQETGHAIPLLLTFSEPKDEADWSAIFAPALDCLNWR